MSDTKTEEQNIEEKLQPIFISTSSNKGGVGKTTTSVAIALSCAELGLPTLYLEQDYGNPSGHKYLGLRGAINPEEAKGVGEVLLARKDQQIDLEKVIHQTFPYNPELREKFPRLSYVACGTTHVSERSAITDFAKGYEKVKEEAKRLGYKIVIFDMPAGVDPYVLDGVLRTNRVIIVNPDPLYNSRDGSLRLLRKARERAIDKIATNLQIPTPVKKIIHQMLNKELTTEGRQQVLNKLYSLIQTKAPDKLEAYDRMREYIQEFRSHAIFTNGTTEECSTGMLDLEIEATKYGINIIPLTQIPFSNRIKTSQPFFYYNTEVEALAQNGQGPIPLIRSARNQLLEISKSQTK